MLKQLVTAKGFEGGLGGRAWSPGIKVGPWLVMSGLTAIDFETGQNVGIAPGSPTTPGKVDPEAQWRKVLDNIKGMVESAGGTMADIVLANVFVTDIRYYTEYEWVRKEYFEPPYPVCTALAVRGLVSPDWILEIECTAYIEDKD